MSIDRRRPSSLGPAALLLVAAVPASFANAPPPAIAMEPRIARLEIDVVVDPATGGLTENVTLGLVGSTGATAIDFTIADDLTVERATADTGFVEARKAGDRLRVHLDPPLDGGRTLTFRVTGAPRRGATPLVAPERVALSGDDPWYPRLPGEWATARIVAHLPPGWAAVGPGKPDGAGDDGTFAWTSSEPLRSVALVAAPGLRASEAALAGHRLRVVAPAGGPDAGALAGLFRDPFSWIGGALAPYPFGDLAVAIVPGLPFPVRGSGVVARAPGAPLETRADAALWIASQWFGERLRGDPGLLEGLAAWESATYARDRAIPLPAEVVAARRRYLEHPLASEPTLADAGAGAPQEVVLGKGSAAPDMIRLEIGDRAFLAAIRDLFEAPVTARTAVGDVRRACEARAGGKLDAPFHAWYERPGVPDLHAVLRVLPAGSGGYRADLAVTQSGPVYPLTLDVVLVGAGEERRETLRIEASPFSVYYLVPFRPGRLVLDPLGRLFMRPPVVEGP